jgi:lipoate-protein ligase A
MPQIRLLPFASADGPTNMAVDEVLLEAAASGTASLRFYTWDPPTLSLGYFQLESARHAFPHLAKLPFVRRASGGSTLVHHHELTYALALPAGLPWQQRGESWVCRMHRIIVAALEVLAGVACECVGSEERKLGEVLCFLQHTPGDVILKGHKIVGSAQRKQRGAMLQHGGVLSARSEHIPGLPGLRELAGVSLSYPDLASAILRQFRAETGWMAEACDLIPAERQRAHELAETKYGSREWNEKR